MKLNKNIYSKLSYEFSLFEIQLQTHYTNINKINQFKKSIIHTGYDYTLILYPMKFEMQTDLIFRTVDYGKI